MKYTFSAFAMLAIIFGLYSCAKDNLQELQKDDPGNSVCDTSFAVSYQNDIVPILTIDCYECHSQANAPTLASGNVLEGYSSVMAFVDLNDPSNSKLLCTIQHECFPFMPQQLGLPKISDCKIARIEAWINQGALNN